MKPWTYAVWVGVALLPIVGLFGYLSLSRTSPLLTVATWAGPYGNAQVRAMLQPFGNRSGADMRVSIYDGGTVDLARVVASKRYDWDVIDLELPDAVAACHQGLLEPMDASSLPPGPDGEPPQSDFAPGALGPCWIGSVIYSQVIAYDPHHLTGVAPTTIADFFDLQRFPGKRAMHRSSGKLNLEMALLADGVPPAQVYDTLSTPQGIDRALAKLSTLQGNLVWWTDNDPPWLILSDGRAAMSTILNGDIFDAATHGTRLGVVWDRQLYEFEAFGIPKGDPKRKLAMDFIRFATQAQNLAAVADWVPYGPARRSALRYVGMHPELDIEMAQFLPTEGNRMATAFAVDDEWWRLHGADVDARWQNWLSQQK